MQTNHYDFFDQLDEHNALLPHLDNDSDLNNTPNPAKLLTRLPPFMQPYIGVLKELFQTLEAANGIPTENTSESSPFPSTAGLTEPETPTAFSILQQVMVRDSSFNAFRDMAEEGNRKGFLALPEPVKKFIALWDEFALNPTYVDDN